MQQFHLCANCTDFTISGTQWDWKYLTECNNLGIKVQFCCALKWGSYSEIWLIYRDRLAFNIGFYSRTWEPQNSFKARRNLKFKLSPIYHFSEVELFRISCNTDRREKSALPTILLELRNLCMKWELVKRISNILSAVMWKTLFMKSLPKRSFSETVSFTAKERQRDWVKK